MANMTNAQKYALAALCALLLLVWGFPLLIIAVQTEVGDTRITSTEVAVYSSYRPGALGEQVCALPKDAEVEILEIVTSNDFQTGEKTMVAEVKAYRMKTTWCEGWLFPKDLK